MSASLLAVLLMGQTAPSPTQAAPALTQEASAPAAATPPTAEDIAFADFNDRMTVAVAIATRGPFAFVVDTGAERTVVSRDLATELTLRDGPIVSLLTMTGRAQAPTVYVPALRIGAIEGRDVLAPLLERRNLGALGILGLDVLQNKTVSIDFERHVMTVTPSARRRRRVSHSPDEIIVEARNLFGQLVVTDAEFRGSRIRVVLDTGSVATIGNDAFRRLALRERPAPRSTTLVSVTGATLLAGEADIDRLTIGGIALDRLPVAFAEAAPFARFGLSQRPALMLGIDTMRLFRRVEIDFANRQVRFLLPRNAGQAVNMPGETHIPMN